LTRLTRATSLLPNIDKAPRNVQGRIEAMDDVVMLRPADARQLEGNI
jgi:hypothetical protein